MHDYDGPLGALEDRLAARRIAVAVDDGGRPFLVRPDSVVLEFGDDADAYAKVRAVIVDHELDVLGTPPGVGPPRDPPASGTIAARLYPQLPQPDRSRWPTTSVTRLLEAVGATPYTARPNQVYLADGVGRHFGILGASTNGGTPGMSGPPPESVEPTVRPAAPAPLAARVDRPGRPRPEVLVLDTGLRTRDGQVEHPDLDNCRLHEPWRVYRHSNGVGRWDDEDGPDDDGAGRLDQQAGHGTFVSGILRQLGPDAVVHHEGVLTSYGDGDAASVNAAAERALARFPDGPDIVVMAFGGYWTGDGEPPMAAAVRRLQERSLVVAAAGNDHTSRPYYPAALPGVIGVGALDENRPAAFTNFGPWVDACAPAVDVVSTYFTDFDDRAADGTVVGRYRGWAAWSGTSFSAPKVAAAIAQEMFLHGGTAAEAWARLSPPSAARLPDLGIVVNA